MEINTLEILRKNSLKQIDSLKPLVILITFLIPLLVVFGLKFKIGKMVFASLFIPIFLYIWDIFKLYKTPKFKAELILYVALVLVAGFILKNSLPFKLVAVVCLTGLSMLSIYKLIMKKVKEVKEQNFKDEFKDKFLKPYFDELGYNYEIDTIGNNYIKNSRLFEESVDLLDYDNDKISGENDGVWFGFGDVVLYDSKKEYEIWGVFFYAEFNKMANSNTFVISNDTTNQNSKKFRKITMDDSEFNSYFSVYTDDTQNAMYLLSPSLMRQLLNLKKRLKFPISLSFVGDKIYIFTDTGKDSFEPDINKSVLKENPAFAIKLELSQFLAIVKTPNLNRKIWRV
ncbi:MAG: DUF3137 domain-containing protein [Campylobacter sp.]|nr:DUF3137 domain-containing protein [Campylobacter sp.]MBQ9876396.1 DUF3137 domain-containing protein [Campylobacter sp.]